MKITAFRLVGKMGFPWSEVRGLRFCAEPSAAQEISAYWMGSAGSPPSVSEAMGGLQRVVHGCYALVYSDGSRVLLGTDIVASVPLFYRVGDSKVFVSDDAALIASGMVDEKLVSEYMCAGYTLGADTIDPKVMQVQAGEWVEIDLETGSVSRHDGWTFTRTFENDSPSLEELERALLASVSRSIEGHSGAIAVPLSGGFDSRSIAYALKSLGVGNVTCFSYGRSGNSEAETSRRIASSLGYEWRFVEYSPESVAEHISGEYARDAADYFMLGRVPCMQSELAFRSLRRSGAIPKGALLLPGHAGDFVAGSHLDASLLVSGADPVGRAVECILRKHMNLAPVPDQEASRIGALLEGCLSETPAVLTELFDWRERQAKFTAFDPWYAVGEGCRYSLPLWDLEFVEFWRSLSVDRLMGRALNRDFINLHVNPACGLPSEPPASVRPRGGVRARARRLLGDHALSRTLRLALALCNRGRDPLCVNSCAPLPRLVHDTLLGGVVPNANSLCIEALLAEYLKGALNDG